MKKWYALYNIYVWIYENGVKELHPTHPYFTLISLNLCAFFMRSQRAKNRERRAMKGRKIGRGRKKGLIFLLIFISLVSGVKKTPA